MSHAQLPSSDFLLWYVVGASTHKSDTIYEAIALTRYGDGDHYGNGNGYGYGYGAGYTFCNGATFGYGFVGGNSAGSGRNYGVPKDAKLF